MKMICSIDDMLKQAAASRPGDVAIIDGAIYATYADLDAQVGLLAEELLARGVARGDRVGILAKKSLGQVVAILAVTRAQAVFVVISGKLKSEQVDFICEDCQARLVIADEAGRRQAASFYIGQNGGEPVMLGPEQGWLLPAMPEGPEEAPCWQSAARDKLTIRGDLACLMYTSGSTGMPKGVMLTHGNLLAGTDSVVSYLDLRSSDRIVSILPFSFDYGLNQLLCTLRTRCRLVLTQTFFPQEIAASILKHAITVCAGVPPVWAQMFHAARGVWDMAPFLSVRIVTNSGGKVPPPMLENLKKAFPKAKVFLMYGLTEAFRSTFLAPEQLPLRPGSIGKAVPNAEVFLVNDNGQPTMPGELGEIVHRGDTVAMGYWNRPKDTAKVFRPHPFVCQAGALPQHVVYSGDYAVQDEEGFMYYRGRRDQQMKVAGMRVSPEEIETAIAGIEKVSECVVVTGAGDENGDGIVAFVLPHGALTKEAVLSRCGQMLPRHMIPREIRICRFFPRLENGKTDRMALKESLIGLRQTDDGQTAGSLSENGRC